jgi:hypothetical protein
VTKKSEGIVSLLIVFTNNSLSLIVSSHFQKKIIPWVLHPENTVISPRHTKPGFWVPVPPLIPTILIRTASARCTFSETEMQRGPRPNTIADWLVKFVFPTQKVGRRESIY